MNNKTMWTMVFAVVMLLAIIVLANMKSSANKAVVPQPTPVDPLNATYTVEDQPVTFTNGKATGSNAIFGKPAIGDLNGDGTPDAAVILVQQPGGSGTFYYVAAAISVPGGTTGTNAILLGDRIAPQSIDIKNGQIVVNYADRKPSDPFSTPPSVGVTKYFDYRSGTLQVTVPLAGAGEHCGGNMTTAATCAPGYHCAPAPGSHLPFGDVGGTCVAN